MRLSPPSWVVVLVLSTAGACRLNSVGLAPDAGQSAVVASGGTSGSAGVGGLAGMSPLTGEAGAPAGAGSSGSAGVGGGAGSDDSGGVSGGAGSGAAGDGLAGIGGAGVGGGSGADGVAGAAGATSAGQAGETELPDASGAAGMTTGVDAHPVISPYGCSDGTREGFTSLEKFPDVAACSGGWDVAGLVAPETLTPQCQRRAGNDGAKPDGAGCSVADLCAEGWHVCESAHEFAMKGTDCTQAFPGGAIKMFFATRQKGPMTTCDPANLMGTNNVYGCGNFGSNAMTACAPFMHMLRDADCKANPPWMCVDGPVNNSVTELLDVTKPGPDKGGVLCCR